MAVLSAGMLAAFPAMLGGANAQASATAPRMQLGVPQENTWLDDWTSIAVISGADGIALTHVSNLLSLHGIGAMSMGSLSYGVFVENINANRAKRVLIDDATKNPYWLHVGDKSFDRADKTITVQINRTPDEYGRIKTDPRDPFIERAVREVYMSLNPKPGETTQGEPKWDFVKYIETAKRRYLDERGHWNAGYDFTVQFGATESKGAYYDYRGCVWDEGKECQLSGGGGSYR